MHIAPNVSLFLRRNTERLEILPSECARREGAYRRDELSHA